MHYTWQLDLVDIRLKFDIFKQKNHKIDDWALDVGISRMSILVHKFSRRFQLLKTAHPPLPLYFVKKEWLAMWISDEADGTPSTQFHIV